MRISCKFTTDSATVKYFWKSVNIWVSYGQEFSVLFLDSRCRMKDIQYGSIVAKLLSYWPGSCLMPYAMVNHFIISQQDNSSYFRRFAEITKQPRSFAISFSHRTKWDCFVRTSDTGWVAYPEFHFRIVNFSRSYRLILDRNTLQSVHCCCLKLHSNTYTVQCDSTFYIPEIFWMFFSNS